MLNHNHKIGMRSIFQSLDASLTRALDVLNLTQEQSPFSDIVPDATPVQRKVVAEYVSRIRTIMRNALETQGVALTREKHGSVWSAQLAVLSAAITLEELHPKRLRGYGSLDPDDAEWLARVSAQLDDLLERVRAYLAAGAAADLDERLARLTATEPVQMLRKLERIITKHGLIEFRSTLEMLLDRIESNGFEIAVFGRVSSGKSSLLNYIIEADVLPVGVTPVTAIPTRIHFGPKPQAIIEFAEARPFVTSPQEIAQFASEQWNPGNAKHVTKIEVELPARRLEQGITLVDTPGVGSLALSGAAESMAYLPRCDLGLVLVDAASTLVSEDVALVDLLYRAGASVQVLLSKADTLSESDRRQAVTYVRKQLRIQTETEVPTFAVSVRAADSALCDQWLAESLAPMLKRHQRLANESIRRKIIILHDALAASLRSWLNRSAAARIEHDWQAAKIALTEGMSRLDLTARQFDDTLTASQTVAARVIDQAALQLSQAGTNNGKQAPTVGSVLARILHAEAGEMAAERVRVVTDLQAALIESLRLAAERVERQPPGGELIRVSDVPLPDIDLSRLNMPLKRSWRPMLGVGNLAHDIRRQLDASIRREIEQSLYRYGKTLNAWCRKSLDELKRAFTTRADFCRANCGDYADRTQGPSDDLAADLAELESEGDLALALPSDDVTD